MGYKTIILKKKFSNRKKEGEVYKVLSGVGIKSFWKRISRDEEK